jgi:hypothetical protein
VKLLSKPVIYTAVFVGGVFVGWIVRGAYDKRVHDRMAAEAVARHLTASGQAIPASVLAAAKMQQPAANTATQLLQPQAPQAQPQFVPVAVPAGATPQVPPPPAAPAAAG